MTTQPPSTTLDTTGGKLSTWLRFTLVMLVLAGLVYPLVTTLMAGALFPWQAEGSLIERNGVLVGSRLVGQQFAAEGYFIGRPSAADYDPANVSGSNLAVSNPELRVRATQTSQEIAEREGVEPSQIPVDLIAASGSGIDPHISPEAAALQVPRVAAARGLTAEQVMALIDANTHRGPLNLGQPGVNVLELNLALDNLVQSSVNP